MRLHNKLTNEECLGKKVTAYPEPSSPWVETSEGNNGEKDYYRDVFGFDTVKQTGCCIYMDGETFTIIGYEGEDEDEGSVLLRNDRKETEFKIPYYQYKADFGLNW